MSLTFALPMLLVWPIGGARADRHDRKRTMLVFCVGQLFNPYLLQVEDKAFLH